jgi:hypothetical protein
VPLSVFKPAAIGYRNFIGMTDTISLAKGVAQSRCQPVLRYQAKSPAQGFSRPVILASARFCFQHHVMSGD